MAKKKQKITTQEEVTQQETIKEAEGAQPGASQAGQPSVSGDQATPPGVEQQPPAPAVTPSAPGGETGGEGPAGKTPEGPGQPSQKPSGKDISPSLKQGDLSKPVDLSKKQGAKDKAKDELKDKAKKATTEPAKKALKQVAKQAAKAAARAVAQAAASAAAAVVATVGWPVVIGCIVVFIIVALIFGGLMCVAMKGYFGKTYPTPAGQNDPNVQKIIEFGKKISQGPYHVIDFLSNEDKDYVEAGKLDKRLAAALVYLAERHNRLVISYVVSTYNKMPTNPEDSSQLAQNVSAHKEGLAADIAEIDFVYKAWVPDPICPTGAFDLVYYADKPVKVAGTSAAQTSIIPQISTEDNGLNQSFDELLAKLDQLSQNVDSQQKIQIEKLKAQIRANQANNTQSQQAIAALSAQLASLEAQLQKQTSQDTTELKQKIAQLKTAIAQMQQALQQANQMIVQLNTQLENLQTEIAEGKKDLDKIQNTLNTIQSFQNVGVFHDLSSISGQIGALAEDANKLIGNLQQNLPNFNNLMSQFNNHLGVLGGIPGFGGLGGDYKELLRLFCEGSAAGATADANTTINGNPAKAIPIKVSWQDDKPDIQHVSNAPDESASTDPRVFYIVYRPQAREKTHQVIEQLLQFPYDMNDVEYYKVTQLITYSYDRDVAAFASKLDALYGKVRPANYGLFSMPESWAQVHIGY